MNQEVEIGIIGEFDPDRRYHIATNEALNHAATALSVSLKASWISTQSLNTDSVEAALKSFHGLWCAPGDYRSIDGALLAIQFAREKGWPFIGT
jgi:CTP synthase (UTP-ammonia lyase)